jgi:hypothetical protein
VLTKLKNLNASKAPGRDGIPNWILKTYGKILASPISNLLNMSYQEAKKNFLSSGKEQTSLLSQKKPVLEINKHLNLELHEQQNCCNLQQNLISTHVK